jgi:hypothetical protein
MSVGEFKTHFSEVLQQVKAGVGIAVTYGRRKDIIGYFVPKIKNTSVKRKLGILKGKAEVTFNDDFKISEEEFLGL